MKWTIFAGKGLALFFAMMVGAVTAQNDQWKSYSYAADGFSIAAPVEPLMNRQSVKGEAGSVELRSYQVNRGTSSLLVAVADYSQAAKEPDALFKAAENEAVAAVKARLMKDSHVRFGIYPGESYEAENGTLHFSVRLYLVGPVLYQVMAASPLNQQYTGADRFLDSFQLIPRTR